MLKANKFQEFADQQISKAKKIVAMIPGILLFAYFSVKSFVQYGRISGLVSLILGIFSFLCFTVIIVFSTKEYYTINSSMDLLKRILADKDLKSS